MLFLFPHAKWQKSTKHEGERGGGYKILALIDRDQYTIRTVGQLFSASDCGHMVCVQVKGYFVTGFFLAIYGSQNEIIVSFLDHRY